MAKRALSREMQRELAAIMANQIVVAAVKTIADSDAAMLKALGLRLADSALRTGDLRPPERSLGRYAVRNLDGWLERRTDLPLGDREISHWAPSWRGSGSHLVSRTIRAYPVDHHPARLLTATATVLQQL